MPCHALSVPPNTHRSIDVLAVRLYLDRKVEVPYKSNACFGFDKCAPAYIYVCGVYYYYMQQHG